MEKFTMEKESQNFIIYNTADGKASVKLYAQDGMVWMSQNQLAELFDTSKQNIGQHLTNILNEKELFENLVVKNYFTTAADGKKRHDLNTLWQFKEKIRRGH